MEHEIYENKERDGTVEFSFEGQASYMVESCYGTMVDITSSYSETTISIDNRDLSGFLKLLQNALSSTELTAKEKADE